MIELDITKTEEFDERVLDICFEKVSFEQYLKDWKNLYNPNNPNDYDENIVKKIKDIYDNIKLPSRSTKGSAGFDFYSPFSFTMKIGSNIIIPTGIRFKTNTKGVVLCVFPRSGLGTKYGIQIANTVGIIDEDYYEADNEGHIMIKLQMNGQFMPLTIEFSDDDTDSMDHAHTYVNTNLRIESGTKFCQGIVLKYFNDGQEVDKQRTGGFGSTGN